MCLNLWVWHFDLTHPSAGSGILPGKRCITCSSGVWSSHHCSTLNAFTLPLTTPSYTLNVNLLLKGKDTQAPQTVDYLTL